MDRKRRWLVTISILGALAGGVSAAAAAADPGASASATRVLLISNCKDGKFKPKSVVLTCGDAGFIAKRMTWSSWTGKTAGGTGTGVIETCMPDCASGGTKSGPLELTLSKPRTCSGGERVFTKVLWEWTSGAPVGPSSGSEPLGCKLIQS